MLMKLKNTFLYLLLVLLISCNSKNAFSETKENYEESKNERTDLI